MFNFISNEIEYSKNNGSWTELFKSTSGHNKCYTFPDGNAGDKLCLRCNVNEVLAASELEGVEASSGATQQNQ